MAFGPGAPVRFKPNLGGRPSFGGPRVGFRIDPNKIFFDRKAVVDAVGRARAIALRNSSLAIKRSAKRSMRTVTPLNIQIAQKQAGKRKRFTKILGASPPGRPPMAHLPHPFVKKFLFNAFDKTTLSAVAGPEPLRSGRGTFAQRTLEFGGRNTKKVNKRRTKRKLGGTGEIRLGGRVTRSTKQGVTYGRLTTPRMVARANRLNEDLYGPAFTGGTFQKPRPFMKPALLKEVPKMSKRWLGLVKPV